MVDSDSRGGGICCAAAQPACTDACMYTYWVAGLTMILHSPFGLEHDSLQPRLGQGHIMAQMPMKNVCPSVQIGVIVKGYRIPYRAIHFRNGVRKCGTHSLAAYADCGVVGDCMRRGLLLLSG